MVKKNSRRYRRLMKAWKKNRRGRKKPVASKRQGPPVRKKRPRRY